MDVYLPIANLSVNGLLIVSLGALTGLLSGMFGVGGGFLTTPLLIFYGIPPTVAAASAASQVTGASGEDPRYAKILGPARDKGRYASGAFKRVFLPQAVLLWITCLPAQMGVAGSGAEAIGPLAMAGAALWLLGIVFETVGDWQLSRFRADPASKGKVLDTGLWRYTRHPNYFGDACVWWGIWLAASEAGWPVALGSLIGPAFLTFTLTKWSGKPLLEKGMADRRPGYAEYVRKTSGFVPWFPKK